eukprot:CAMPEP_0177646320 /NCGR_PEP_ID=MMETSP0447-20121125/9712_1 /TAXON_ID=0 /ORGANISM="Stygamoeba regulata, Strain BSH-02190019" /LENGTH=600 /DNA_ID=CAMNT_0019148847 /DNA_START=94 /DNA_END=1896 /DNA_ORIENTATION=+
MKLFFVLATLLAFSSLGNALSVRLESSIRSTEQPWTVAVEARNPYSESVAVLRRDCPLSTRLDHPTSFRVYDVTEGRELPYEGALYKRTSVLTDDSFAVIAPGESLRVEIDLSRGYRFEASHHYTVSVGRKASTSAFRLSEQLLQKHARGEAPLATLLGEAGDELATFGSSAQEQSNAHSFVAAENSAHPLDRRDVAHLSTRDSPSFLSCSSDTRSDIGIAKTYLASGLGSVNQYFSNDCEEAHYTRFFGASSSSRYNEVSNNFVAITNGLNGDWILDCTEEDCDPDVYAFVYPNDGSRTIHVCSAFFSAPNTIPNIDTKPGTLVHEMSHFSSVAGTADWVYGVSKCEALASSNPAQAINNADSHEYFFELISQASCTAIPPGPSPPPSSSSSSDGSGISCFPAEATVRTGDGRTLKMSELHVGDSVLARHDDGKLLFSEVYAFLDRKPTGEFDFVRVTGRRQQDENQLLVLEVSPRHRVFRQSGPGAELVDVDAGALRVGQQLQVVNANGSGVEALQIVTVEQVRREGAYAPVTMAGTLVVDEVVASCYAMASHASAHAAFAPLRLATELLPAAASTAEQIGLNWYAELLLNTFGSLYQ